MADRALRGADTPDLMVTQIGGRDAGDPLELSDKSPLDLKALLASRQLGSATLRSRLSTAWESRSTRYNSFFLSIDFLNHTPDLKLSYPFPTCSSSLQTPRPGDNGDHTDDDLNDNSNGMDGTREGNALGSVARIKKRSRRGRNGRWWRSSFLHPLDSPPPSARLSLVQVASLGSSPPRIRPDYSAALTPPMTFLEVYVKEKEEESHKNQNISSEGSELVTGRRRQKLVISGSVESQTRFGGVTPMLGNSPSTTPNDVAFSQSGKEETPLLLLDSAEFLPLGRRSSSTATTKKPTTLQPHSSNNKTKNNLNNNNKFNGNYNNNNNNNNNNNISTSNLNNKKDNLDAASDASRLVFPPHNASAFLSADAAAKADTLSTSVFGFPASGRQQPEQQTSGYYFANWPYGTGTRTGLKSHSISSVCSSTSTKVDRQEHLTGVYRAPSSNSNSNSKRQVSVASTCSILEINEIIGPKDYYRSRISTESLGMNHFVPKSSTRIRKGSTAESSRSPRTTQSPPTTATTTVNPPYVRRESNIANITDRKRNEDRKRDDDRKRNEFISTKTKTKSTEGKPNPRQSSNENAAQRSISRKQAKAAEINKQMKQGTFFNFNDSDSESGEEDDFNLALRGNVAGRKADEDDYEDDGRWHLPGEGSPPKFPSRTKSQGTLSTVSSAASEEIISPLSPSPLELRYYRENTAFALRTPLNKRRKRRRTASSECLLVEAVEGLRTMMLDLGGDDASVITEDDEDDIPKIRGGRVNTYDDIIRAASVQRRGAPLFLGDDPAFVKSHIRFKSVEYS